jgi:hypothetical protein
MLVRVFEIPTFIGATFHFDRGQPMRFVEVDWFRDDDMPLSEPASRSAMDAYVRSKNYFNPDYAYLVLHPTHPLVINCNEDMLMGRRTRG